MLAKSQSRKVLFELPPALAGGLKETSIGFSQTIRSLAKAFKSTFFSHPAKAGRNSFIATLKRDFASWRLCEIKNLANFA